MMDVELTEYDGKSPVVRDVAGKPYSRIPASGYKYDRSKGNSDRQTVFHANLKEIAAAIRSDRIPVDFFLRNRGHVFLDRGCVKMAESAGVIFELSNGPNKVVDYIILRRI